MVFVGELTPGTIARVLAKVEVDGQAKMGAALTAMATAAETATKEALTQTSHSYVDWANGTPARAGGPPALVSGTLRRSITHTHAVPDGIGWATKIGTAAGFYPWYGKGRTPSSKYGMYLELGMLRNGAAYPFLQPSIRRAVAVYGPPIWQSHFRGGW